MLAALTAFFPVTPVFADGISLMAESAAAASPQFSQSPSDSTYSEEADARLYVRADASDSGYLTYEWHRSKGYADPQDKNTESIKTDGASAFSVGHSDESLDADGTKSVLDFKTPAVEGATAYYYYWVTVTNHIDTSGDGDTDDPGETNSRDTGLAEVKVVDRVLPDHITNGDFSTLYAPNGQEVIHWGNAKINDTTVKGAYTIAAQSRLPNWKTTDFNGSIASNISGFGDVRQSFQVFNLDGKPFGYYAANDDDAVAEPDPKPATVATSPSPVTVDDAFKGKSADGHGDNGGNTGNFGAIELANANPSSVYQEVATVPGKIYEWSLDHLRRATSGNEDVMAVVIGSAINEQSDLGTDSGLWDNSGSSVLRYPYGASSNGTPENSPTYFYKIVQALATEIGVGSPANLTSKSGDDFTQEYNGHTYYIYIASTGSSWKTYTGSYTVPAGQGTTVFGFVGIRPISSLGNILDNIKFASGSDLEPEQEATYSGDSSISAETKAGYAYALAEVRGSSVNELTGLSAWYGASGAPEARITPASGGWYKSDSVGGAFADGGTVTFRDLVPGKTYRIIGIPANAINEGLRTNMSPGAVLDNGYYSDVKLLPASGGSGGANASMPSYSMELYGDVTKRVRLTLQNTNAGVQYALLADDGASAPNTSAPAISGASPYGTAWSTGTGAGAGLVFEGLSPNAEYYLVARPLGYTEITYADAAYGVPDETGNPSLAALRILTPAEAATDILPEHVARTNGTTITIAAAGTKEGYTYAAIDPATGAIAGSHPWTGEDISFGSLDAAKAYQVVTSPVEGSYLHGVRVYPYPSVALNKDYTAAAVGMGAGGAGLIPAGIEYRVLASGSGTTAWLVGDGDAEQGKDEWAVFSGTERLSLTDVSVVAAGKAGEDSPAMSLFDALDTLGINGQAAMAVIYRAPSDAGYSGPAVRPESRVSVQSRPFAPQDIASIYEVDYEAESVGFKVPGLEWAQTGSDIWTAIDSGSSLSFGGAGGLGWNGAAARAIRLRYASTQTSFASSETTETIPVRPSAPESLGASLVNPGKAEDGINIKGLIPGREYQYKESGESEWSPAGIFTADPSGIKKLDFGEGHDDYDIRYAATAESPASFFITVSSPLNVESINFGSNVYGETIGPRAIRIHNIVDEPVSVEGARISLSEDDASQFVLNASGTSSVPSAGVYDEWTIAPKPGLDAGNYHTTVNVSYTVGTKEYTASANVYLVIGKATWDMSGVLLPGNTEVSGVSANGFTITLAGAPNGAPTANLSYNILGDTWSDGGYIKSFGSLSEHTAYSVRVRAKEDPNHNQSPVVTAATVYTAYAAPDIASVLHINYGEETLSFAGGYTPANYTLKLNGSPAMNNVSLSDMAGAGNISIGLTRNASGSYPASSESVGSIPGKAEALPVVKDGLPAEGGVTTINAGDDTSTTGRIEYASSFQYRVSRNGANVTQGWQLVTNSVNVTAGRYEVRLAPTDSAFASKITSVTVGSDKPTVTLHTRTASTGQPAPNDKALPSYIDMPSGWIGSNDPERPGEYGREYRGASIPLPGVSAVTSTSHVFQGWYEENQYDATTGEFTGNPAITVPATGGGDTPLGKVYYAKWSVRPTVSGVTTEAGSAIITSDNSTTSKGLSSGDPVRMDVHLAPGQGSLSLSQISLSGQSTAGGTAAAKLYTGADFSSGDLGSGSAIIAWGAAPTKLYLKTVSADDGATAVYYELSVYATRVVSFAAEQTGGAGGDPNVRTSTGIDITFDEEVKGLAASNIDITDVTGKAVKGTLTNKDGGADGKSYSLALTEVTQGGQVSVEISALAGYLISNTGQGADDSATSRQISVYRDGAAPTATVKYKDRAFMDFLNKATFGLFFKDTVSVAIKALDTGGDGIDKVSYMESSSVIAEGDLPNVADSKWTSGASGVSEVSFNRSANNKFILYVKVSDKAGNATFYKDGIVVYKDSAVETGSITYTRTSGTDQTAAVALNGNTVVSIVNDGGTPADDLDDEELKAGGGSPDYSVDGNNITVKANYLETLSAGDSGKSYKLTLSYNPLGEVYEEDNRGSADADLNEAPKATTLDINVVKAAADVTLSAVPTSSVTYGASTTLTASVSKSGTVSPTGSVIFYNGSTPIGDSSQQEGVALSAAGMASITIELDADTYEDIHAEYAGDENYKAGSGSLGSYTVDKASQSGVVIYDAGTNIISGTVVGKKREDVSFTVSAVGGQSSGDYHWSALPGSAAGAVSITPSGPDNADATITVSGAGAVGTTAITLTKDGDGNYLASTPVLFTLNVNEESTFPVPGGAAELGPDSTITASDIGQDSARLSWEAATDAFPVPEDLTYYVYRSAESNIGSPEDCADNGTLLNAGGTKGLTENLNGLTGGEAFWYNVVVKDAAGNAAAYKEVRIVARKAVSYTVKPIGGQSGRKATAGLLITFDSEVHVLTQAEIIVAAATEGLGALSTGAVSEYDDDDLTTWYVPVHFDTPEKINGKNISITINDWTTPGGRGYDLTNGEGTGKRTQAVKVYGPLTWLTPDAGLDFINERLTGLEPNGTYKFANDGHEYNGDRTVGDDGVYPTIPFSEFDTDLLIKRVGVPEGVTLTDDDLGHLDSPAQTLHVPERPGQPEVSPAQPEDEDNNGGFTITNYEPSKGYEYITVTAFETIQSADDYDDSKWEQVSDATTEDVAPGAYYVRVKATSSSFASDKRAFYIHAYRELGFEALEGYTTGGSSPETDVLAQAINPADESGHAIINVTVKDNDPNFVVSNMGDGNDSTFDVKPKEGLTRGVYEADLELTCDGGIDGSSETSEMHLIFTVYQNAEFAKSNGIVASSSEGDAGLTDTLTLNFEYPVNLNYEDVVIGGAAHKSVDKENFVEIKNDSKTYVLALTALTEKKTGDDIDVTVKLGAHPEYAYQIAKTNKESLTGKAPVTIPRAIAEAHVIPNVPGYATGSIQFTLDRDLSPVLPAGTLMWPLGGEAYDGPVEISPAEIDGDVDVDITAVYYTSADEGYTFRVFLTVNKGGSAALGIPEWGIDPVNVTGDIEEGEILGDIAYFLNGRGSNYLTDIAGYQVLSELGSLPDDPYVARELTLRTSKEYSEGVTASVRVYGPDDDDETSRVLVEDKDYTLNGVGDGNFYFSDGDGTPDHIDDQLVLTLNRDWTRENGAHRIVVVLNDGNDDEEDGFLKNTLLQAVVNVSEVKPTHTLTVTDGEGGTDSSFARSVYGIPSNEDTRDGAFEDGMAVTVTAGAAADGYRFGSWAQIHPDPQQPGHAITLPDASSGSIIMPAEAVTLRADYVDGVAPVTAISPADGTWIKTGGTVALDASDYDVTKGNKVGTVKNTWYLIDSEDEEGKIEYTVPFTLDGEGEGLHTITWWSEDVAGNIESKHTAAIGYDETAPTAAVTIRGETYDGFTAPSGFTRFYKGEAPELAIAVSDGSGDASGSGGDSTSGSGRDSASGVGKVEYIIDAIAGIGDEDPLFESADEAAVDTARTWTAFDSGDEAPTLPDPCRYRVYVRVADKAGNVTAVSSEGIVYYEDGELADQDEGVQSFTRFGTAGVDIGLKLNGNRVFSVTNDMGTPDDPEDDYTLEYGADKDYTVVTWIPDTLTLTQSYLNKLAASVDTPYTINASYAPQGVDYADAEEGSAVNDRPAVTGIALTVVKAGTTLTLNADPGSGEAVYGEPITLTATVAGAAAGGATRPGGTVKFFDGETQLGATAGVEVDEATGIATLTTDAIGEEGPDGNETNVANAPLTAGTHSLRAVYSGDADYSGDEDADTLSSYAIGKAEQAPPVIKYEGSVETSITKQYGDESFMLTASGGNGTGAYEWESENESIARVDKHSGEVSVVAMGSVNIFLRKAGDSNYEDSDNGIDTDVSISLTIGERLVTIEYDKNPALADTKVYNGTDAATLYGSYRIAGLKAGDENSMSVAVGNANFADADAGTGKLVTFTGFGLDGALKDSYKLKAQPEGTTADITQATPVWADGAPVASGIRFGQRVEVSVLSGDALDVNGDPLTGSFAWEQEAQLALPGENDTVLNPSGYTYSAVFTPGGSDSVNYTQLTGSASIPLSKARPRMAGEAGTRPQGSTIFANPPGSDTLADSSITGDVVYDFGFQTKTATGTWTWATPDPSSVAFSREGAQTGAAVFTPDDARIEALEADAAFNVYSPKTEIEEAPGIEAGVYGGKVGDIPFTSSGAVRAVSVEIGTEPEDITGKGEWSWKNPGLFLTSGTGSQKAVAVFTPDDLVDFSKPNPTGYVTAEIELTITLEPADISVDGSGVTAPVITFGDGLEVLEDPSGLGYAFDGVAAFGDTNLSGSVAWEAEDLSAIIPGAEGYETSEDEDGKAYSVRDDGVYYVPAVFTPDAYSYGMAYGEKRFLIKIEVGADEKSRKDLADEVEVIVSEESEQAVLPKVKAAGENYSEKAIARLEEAVAAAEIAVSGSEVVPQSVMEGLLTDLKNAVEGLVHDHPLLSPAPSEIKEKGDEIAVEIKGEYGTVTSVTLNGEAFNLGTESGDDPRGILFEGKAAGSISKGSLVINLSSDFIDTLPNGKYEIVSYFQDGYTKGSGHVSFEIARPTEEDEGDGKEDEDDDDKVDDKAGDKKPVVKNPYGSGATGSNNIQGGTDGSAAGSVDTPSRDNGTDDKDPGSSPDPIPVEDEGARSNIALWLAIALAAAAAIIIIAIIARRRPRDDDSSKGA